MIKSRRMEWDGHAARMGKKKTAYRNLVGRQKEGDHWEDLDAGRRIRLINVMERY
jgi:hypothetical protein